MAIIYLRCADLAKMVERLRRRALKENRIDDASDEVINKRMEVFERETRADARLLPAKKIVHRIDATMSQIRILSEIIQGPRPAEGTPRRARGRLTRTFPQATFLPTRVAVARRATYSPLRQSLYWITRRGPTPTARTRPHGMARPTVLP